MKTKTRDLSTCLKRRLWIVGVCLTTFSFLSVSVAYAVSDNQTVQQQKKGMVIKGKVLGTDGEPIIGASVLVKGSTTGVVTDLDGNYTLSNVSKGAILEFSYVGYVKLTKTVGNETTINAILYEDSQMLEGVEVVAFGTQKKESVIGAISTVKVAELKTPSSNLTNALAGRIAGVIRKLNPYYYKMTNYDYLTGDYAIDIINPDDGSEYLIYDPGGKSITANMYIEAALNYNRDFGKHGVGGLLVYQLRNNLQPNAGSLQASLPYRNVGLSGRFTYAYNNRYFAEFNFGYNGSERFHKSKRFGFFPSAGLAWVVSNESFWDPFKDVVSKLKLRASYGIVGNDAIGSGRFLYLSDINMNDSKYGANFGYNYDYHRDGISVKRYSDPEITWEKSAKTNFALEFTLFNDLNVTAEYYTERRKSILQQRTSIPASMGLWVQPYANLGEAKGHGVDLSLDYNKYFANKSWLQLRGNFTYATSEYMVYEDYEYPGAWWKQKVGYPTNQTWGYIAEGLFVDDNEVANSPVQFGEYGAGDIKYRDVNKDGKITDLDQVPIGYPKEPEIVYGFGASYGYKNWDISVFFQGLARESFWIDYNNVSPFFNTVDTKVVGNRVGHNALAKFIADSHWSEDNRDAYAVWPRLSPTSIENNSKTSTWFMRDGSFLRLKQLEIGYTIPEKVTNKVGIKNLRFYVTGNNLLCFSKFKLWDPEMAGSGLGYPVQRVYNIGLNLTF